MRNQKQHDMWMSVARDKWYQLSIAILDADVDAKVRDICAAVGFPTTKSMRDYFDKWGDTMTKNYGKLPYIKLNSSRYDKYMEMK